MASASESVDSELRGVCGDLVDEPPSIQTLVLKGGGGTIESSGRISEIVGWPQTFPRSGPMVKEEMDEFDRPAFLKWDEILVASLNLEESWDLNSHVRPQQLSSVVRVLKLDESSCHGPEHHPNFSWLVQGLLWPSNWPGLRLES